MSYEPMIKQAEAFVSKYMQKHDNSRLVFHNLQHTQNIVSVANKIAAHYSLDEKDTFIVNAAAWFLFVGYYKDALHPEETSVKMMEDFFTKVGLEIETIELIRKCMLAPSTASTPSTIPERILHDATTFYLGTENFSSYLKLTFKESQLLNNESISKDDWKRNTILLLESHQFYTDYSASRLNAQKQANLEKLKKKNPLLSLTPNSIDAMFEKEGIVVTSNDEVKEKGKEKDKEKGKKNDATDRTIETMFKTTSVNSQRLSSQADTKAHIMISVNSIIISVLLGVVVRKIDEYPHLTVPVLLILLVSLVTIIFSILATRPNIKKRHFTEDDVKENKINMLFFGNFFTMDFERYSNSMLQMMGEKDNLYISMLRNIYEQGIVLAHKYKMLKISYNVFMYGLIISVVAFYIASKYFEPSVSQNQSPL
jgi:predicted metal-dependent HD superfamily phosphohydrolase